MEQKQKLFALISSQRDYHFVAFRFQTKFSLSQYWRECGNASIINSYDTEDELIEHAKYTSDRLYYGGFSQDFSVNANRSAPYQYDLFAIQIKRLNIFLFGFPFQAIAKDIIDDFMPRHFSNGKFQKIDLKRLVKTELKDAEEEAYNAKFGGVAIKLSGDLNITSVNLDGLKPLESDIYTQFFKSSIENDSAYCSVEKCVIKFQIKHEDHFISAANIHLDLFGNFKFYMHRTGSTIYNLPMFFHMLDKYKTIIPTTSTSNPIYRSK